jgi:hypothetical protein
MEKQSASIPWLRLTAETVAIVFGVLLALVLDDWRQERQEREILTSVTLSLRAELERNQRALEANLPYHESMLDSLDARLAPSERGRRTLWVQAAQLPILRQLGFEEGVRTEVSLATGAWEAARASGALTRIGIDELFLLSAAYTAMADLDRALERLAERHDRYTVAIHEPVRSAAPLVDLVSGLRAVVVREVELCDTYRTLARRLTGAGEVAEGRCGSGSVIIR